MRGSLSRVQTGSVSIDTTQISERERETLRSHRPVQSLFLVRRFAQLDAVVQAGAPAAPFWIAIQCTQCHFALERVHACEGRAVVFDMTSVSGDINSVKNSRLQWSFVPLSEVSLTTWRR